MPWYELKAYRRELGGPSAGLHEGSATFEASGDNEARSEAHRRVLNFPAKDYAVLYDDEGTQIWTGEAPDA